MADYESATNLGGEMNKNIGGWIKKRQAQRSQEFLDPSSANPGATPTPKPSATPDKPDKKSGGY